jgi:protocatechuate 3,4-dioxygenase beta subunit
MKTATLAVGLLLAVSLSAQVDPMWLRYWEQAQESRPRTIGKIGRIAPAREPGTPLVVRGRVLQADGSTPANGVIVFAYQTDRNGVYNEPRTPGYRLRGWAKSGADGRFEFHTIRPGSYPGTRNPAHIHFTIEGPGIPRRWTSDVQFADDPVVEHKDDTFLPVTVRDGVQYVDFTIRVEDSGRF